MSQPSPPFSLLVNALPLTGRLTGIARYVRSLYTAIEASGQARVGYFDGREVVGTMPAQDSRPSRITKSDRLRRLPAPLAFPLRVGHWLRFEHRLQRAVARHRPALYHETGFFPAAVDLPVVHTIYDLSLRRWPETHPRERVWFYEFFIRRRLHEAAHILTISEYVRREILEEFRLPERMVTAIPLAPDPHFFPRSATKQEGIRRRLGLDGPYLLFVGTLEPRKNIGLLIDALALSRHDLPLVLAGWAGWGDKTWLQRLKQRGLDRRVILGGHVGEEDLACLYSGALALVYPSLYEGFGLPILEAMACGCPVVCANSACLPETAGGAAMLVDPHEAEELAAALDQLVENETLQGEMSERGRRRAALFTWEKTARRTLAVFSAVTAAR
jgi:alpha-1,3-rhamnosyl/mannosyltransferase